MMLAYLVFTILFSAGICQIRKAETTPSSSTCAGFPCIIDDDICVMVNQCFMDEPCVLVPECVPWYWVIEAPFSPLNCTASADIDTYICKYVGVPETIQGSGSGEEPPEIETFGPGEGSEEVFEDCSFVTCKFAHFCIQPPCANPKCVPLYFALLPWWITESECQEELWLEFSGSGEEIDWEELTVTDTIEEGSGGIAP